VEVTDYRAAVHPTESPSTVVDDDILPPTVLTTIDSLEDEETTPLNKRVEKAPPLKDDPIQPTYSWQNSA